MINITEPNHPKYEEGYIAGRVTDVSIGKNPYKALTTDWSKWNDGFNHGKRDAKIDHKRWQLEQAQKARLSKNV